MMIAIEKDFIDGKPFLRFTNLDRKADVEAFISEHRLDVDLALSFMVSGGSLNGRP